MSEQFATSMQEESKTLAMLTNLWNGELKERIAHRIQIIKLVEFGCPETEGDGLWA